jgi:hypothetical protein
MFRSLDWDDFDVVDQHVGAALGDQVDARAAAVSRASPNTIRQQRARVAEIVGPPWNYRGQDCRRTVFARPSDRSTLAALSGLAIRGPRQSLNGLRDGSLNLLDVRAWANFPALALVALLAGRAAQALEPIIDSADETLRPSYLVG